MIHVDALTKTYGGFTAVDHVTFSAEAGRVTGFLGPNGAGKSTTMRILVGLTPASSGTATVLGRRYADLPNPGREIGVTMLIVGAPEIAFVAPDNSWAEIAKMIGRRREQPNQHGCEKDSADLQHAARVEPALRHRFRRRRS